MDRPEPEDGADDRGRPDHHDAGHRHQELLGGPVGEARDERPAQDAAQDAAAIEEDNQAPGLPGVVNVVDGHPEAGDEDRDQNARPDPIDEVDEGRALAESSLQEPRDEHSRGGEEDQAGDDQAPEGLPVLEPCVPEDDQSRGDDREEVGDGEAADTFLIDEIGGPQGVDDRVRRGDEKEVQEDQDGELLFPRLELGQPAQDLVGAHGGDADPPSGRAGERLTIMGRGVNASEAGHHSSRAARRALANPGSGSSGSASFQISRNFR